MNCRYKCNHLMKLLGLFFSCIAGMFIMHAFEMVKDNQTDQTEVSAMIARHQREVNSNALPVRLEKDELRYGKVVRGTKHIIFYNSIPKCGSRTFESASLAVFKKQSIAVPLFRLIHRDGAKLTTKELHDLVDGLKAPAFGSGHGLFESFDQEPRPVYVNFIRDPVSRAVSLFYWHLNGDLKATGRHSTYNWTLEECIALQHDYCTAPGVPLWQFCGYDRRCSPYHSWGNSTWALEKAKSNIDKYHTYIGISEDYEASLRILERLVPDMYRGVTDLYLSTLNDSSSLSKLTKTIKKDHLPQHLNNTLRKRFAIDYQLYNHIYNKHRALKARFGIK